MANFQGNFSTHAWSVSIDKLLFWKTGSWVNYDCNTKNIVLKIHFDQLLIISENKILESLNMNSKLKGIYKGDVLIIITSEIGQEVRKIKCQIRNNSNRIIKKLGEHFPMTCHNSISKKDKTVFRNLEDIFRIALNENASKNTVQLPYNYSDFVKVCLLDPTFPALVQETQQIIKKIDGKHQHQF